MLGLREACAASAGDPREGQYSVEWSRRMKSLWRNQSPGQNQAQMMPIYGSGGLDLSEIDMWRMPFPQ
jgi:hypothetical protein